MLRKPRSEKGKRKVREKVRYHHQRRQPLADISFEQKKRGRKVKCSMPQRENP